MSAVATQPAFTAEVAPDAELDVFDAPLKGPQALSGDPRRFWALAFTIAKSNWKLRFFGSFLGYLWQLIRPLMLFAVLYVFFTKVAHVARGAGTGPGQPLHFYGAQLLGAIVLFTFFQEATSMAVRSVVDNEALVRKIQFPRMVIPVSVVLLAFFNVCLNMLVVFIFAFIEGVRPMVTWLEFFPIILLVAVFASGMAMLLASAFVYFRDIQPIWEVVLQVIFYASPVIIPMTTVAHSPTNAGGLGPSLVHIYMLNPLAVALQQFKHAMINHATFGAAGYAGGYPRLLIPIGISVVVFGLGVYVFNRVAPYVAENL